MEILIKARQLNDKRLSLVQRGIMITLMFVKDDNPKMTLAKFKVGVKMKDIKEDLIKLHELKCVKWSGYKTAVKSLEAKVINPDVKEAIEFMNSLYKRRFDYKSTATTSFLADKLKSHSLSDIKGVIANRHIAWKDNHMRTNLNPVTIFRNKH